ncbi:NAD-dependent epimerase/dehydratase family protein [Thalassorhabdus alkalitolerans]|uniref:NAD-dependent epimerase/dehydratase family protein n=1 Tax=Thalassorhabdus alkalitolerans TaxID=2282697 RepID=A0ABW0YGL0_9BACI
MKKVVIFGATGHTGAYLVDYFLENFDPSVYEVVAVGRKKTDYFKKRGIKYHSVDIMQASDFEKLPKKEIHAVVLLSAILPAAMEGYHPAKYLNTNIIGAFNVLEYCRNVKADRIIYTQTIRDIGNFIGTGEPLTSDMPRNFSYTGDHAVYIISKNTAVDLIEHYSQDYGIKQFVFRLPTIYSYSPIDYYFVDGVKKTKAYRHMIKQAIKGAPIEMWGDPTKAHDIVYVKDFCQMVSKAITNEGKGGFYNVGTGIPVSLREQIEGMIEVFSPKESPSKIIPKPDKPNSRSYVIDITKAKQELGYNPRYDYISYLKDFKKEMELDRYKDLRK